MPVATGIDSFVAFERQLRTLCLNEFPCGTGSWRTSTDKSNPGTQFSVTLRNYGAGQEQEETLEELVTSKYSPYSVDYTWSREARQLREIAVKSPWLITRDYILNHFRTMKIVDKNVSQVDSGMLQFPKLTELTLSVNRLQSVDSCNLPRTLEVLELVANEISDLEPLCSDPPPSLHHLGLGLNRLSAIHDYLTEPYWPCLLSLDLSYNNLCDLKAILHKLESLPKLRNLVLIGNPLALIPGYRGFTVDNLRKLTILDDIQISADEKHHYKGLARRREFVRDEAEIVIKLSALSGVPMPTELQAIEELPEFPVITRTSYVEFLFLEDFMNAPESDEQKDEGLGDKVDEKEKEAASPTAKDLTQSQNQPADQVSDSKQAVTCDQEQPPLIAVTEADDTSVIQTETENESGKDKETLSQQPLKLVPYRTEGLPWSEEGFELAYEREIIIDDLPALKELLKTGLDISIREDKVLSYPAEEDGRASAISQKKGGKDKDGGKPDKRGASGIAKAKDKPDKSKEAKAGKDEGKKKKKKEPEIEMNHLPPEVTVLGTYHIRLAEIINGETKIEEVCICGGGALEAEEEEKQEETSDGKKDKKKKRDTGESAKGKKGKDAKQDKDKGKKQGKGDAKDGKKDAGKGKRPMSGVTLNTEEEEEEKSPPPPPLTVTVEVQLVQWRTAQDSIPKLKPPVEVQNEEGKSEVQT